MQMFGSTGLVPVEPESFAAAGLDLFGRVLDQPQRYDEALREGGSLFEDAGQEAPLAPDGDPPLFVIREDGRHRVRRAGDRWTVNDTATGRDDLLALAEIHRRKGELDEAENFVQEALEVEPEQPRAHRHLLKIALDTLRANGFR